MIVNFTDANRLVYHYTTSATALEHILKSRSLRFSSYTKTNDPKESKAWQFNLGTNEQRDLGKYDMQELSLWLSNALKTRTKLACFSRDSSPLTGNHLREIFQRGFCKSRMWAQYADRHTGVCLVFERERLHNLIEKRFSSDHLVLSGCVNYLNRSVLPQLEEQQYTINVDFLESVGLEAYVGSHVLTHHQRLFFEKLEDWRDESEFRWVIFANTVNDLFVEFENSLVGIIFGENTDESAIERIMKSTESWGLHYMGLKWKNCSPWYDYGNLRYMKVMKISPDCSKENRE